MRKLLLLQNPGIPQVNFVPQVRSVIQRYRQYFQSPVGGYWSDDEIIEEPANMTRTVELEWINYILQNLDSPANQYTMIVFVGHGGIIQHEDHIQLSHGALLPINQLCTHNGFIRRTVIIDACRSYVGVNRDQLILEQRQFTQNDQLIGIHCRDYYNRIIATTTPHVDLIQSTSYGHVAHAIPTGTAFSNALFTSLTDIAGLWNADAITRPHRELSVSTEEIMRLAALRMRNWNQVPQIRQYGEGQHFPFYIVKRN